jgi:hypothetical protein
VMKLSASSATTVARAAPMVLHRSPANNAMESKRRIRLSRRHAGAPARSPLLAGLARSACRRRDVGKIGPIGLLLRSIWPSSRRSQSLPDMSHFAAEFYECCANPAGPF